jgi:hypothetical protein
MRISDMVNTCSLKFHSAKPQSPNGRDSALPTPPPGESQIGNFRFEMKSAPQSQGWGVD